MRICPSCGHHFVTVKRDSAVAVHGLTRNEKEVLEVITEFVAAMGYSPSYDEIAQMTGRKGKSRIHFVVTSLIDRGYVMRLPKRWRSLMLVTLMPRQDVPDAAAA